MGIFGAPEGRFSVSGQIRHVGGIGPFRAHFDNVDQLGSYLSDRDLSGLHLSFSFIKFELRLFVKTCVFIALDSYIGRGKERV